MNLSTNLVESEASGEGGGLLTPGTFGTPLSGGGNSPEGGGNGIGVLGGEI